MLRYSSSRLFASLVLALATLSVVPHVNAACGCPSDGNSAPKAATGLGQEFPSAVDLAADSAWQVYEFERDGVRYTQVNDQYGNVRVATGRIGGTFWVMPIGTDVERVSVPGDTIPTGQKKSLYRSNDVEVILYQDGTQQKWLIRSPAVTE